MNKKLVLHKRSKYCHRNIEGEMNIHMTTDMWYCWEITKQVYFICDFALIFVFVNLKVSCREVSVDFVPLLRDGK